MLAALFAFMNEGNASLDVGERPGPVALTAWEKAEGVLGVTGKVEVTKITHRTTVAVDAVALSEAPPSNPEATQDWAIAWARERARHKSARNYVEADRIRALLAEHGFQVRDSRDGSIEVVRTVVPKG